MLNLYKSPQWREIGSLDRAELLLVIEGLKKGSIIKLPDLERFEYIKNEAKLDYVSIDAISRVIYVTQQNNFLKKIEDLLLGKIKVDQITFDKMLGNYLGYPVCCIEEYVKDRTLKQKVNSQKGLRKLSYKFGQELDAIQKVGGKYDEIWNYLPSAFTPCGVDCIKAKSLLISYKNALDYLDSEASKSLVEFNKKYFCKEFCF